MEVMHQPVVVEEEEVAAVEEEQLRLRRRSADLGDRKELISDEKSVYFDKNEDHTKIQWSGNECDEISKIISDVINHETLGGGSKDGILSISTTTENKEEEEDDEEEVIELEFESAVEKVHTHTPYCPNCSNRITKVILRRKKRASPRPEKPLDLLGCLRCFSIFIPSGDCLNPFSLFRSKSKVETAKIEGQQPSSTDVGGTTTAAGGSKPSVDDVESTTPNAAGPGRGLNSVNLFRSKPKPKTPKIEGEKPSTDLGSTTTDAGVISGETKPRQPPHVTVDIQTGSETNGGRPSGSDQGSKWFEILKCIVYGGLIESITSLSIVASAAASDATTLNVVVIGLATLFSGLIAFGCNLVELRNDNSNNKYEEALGRKGQFVVHWTFAVLSYLVFGLVAPTTYGFAFPNSSDKEEYMILAVVAAALGCIFILAIAKAYVNGTDKLGGYVKTTSYYVILAVSACGVAYGAGDLIGMLLDNLGWFQSGGDVVTPLVSASWASY